MRTVLYARVSSDRQDVDLSISAQLKALRDYATRNNHTIVKEFVDQAESGRTAYRPQFREMISLAKRPERPFELILVYKYSRFARSREDSIVYKALLKKSGVQLVSITEPLDDSAVGRLMQSIIECIDEFYSENLGEEVTRGMRESASRGFYLSSQPPYGYRKVKVNDGGKERTKLELDEFQSRVIANIFDEVIKGKGLTEIVKTLNTKGIAGPKGNGWGKTTLRQMLANEVYTGTLVWGHNSKRLLPPIRVENACPSVVNRQVFQQAQSLIGQRAFGQIHPRRASSQYLLSGLARCGHCGKALIGMEAKSGEFSYYVCGTLAKKGAGSCSARYHNTKKLENLVVDKIREKILTAENLTELAKEVAKEMNISSEAYRTEQDTVENEIADVTRRLGRIYEVIETGRVVPDDVGPRIRELRERGGKLQARKEELHVFLADNLEEAPSLEEVTECANDLKNVLERGSLSEKKAFILSFVKELRIIGDEARLTYTLPPLTKGLEEEGEAVLATEQRGGRYKARTCDLQCVKLML